MFNYVIPPSSKRVYRSTHPLTNVRIRSHTINNLNLYKNSGNEILTDRIRTLNCEWDTERLLEVNAGSLIILCSILGFKSSKITSLLTGTIGALLLNHALQGWCPPVPILRNMGIRTPEEINNEKTVLKILRKDFSTETDDVKEMLSFVEKE